MSKNMDRRAFLRNATVGVAAIAGAGVLAGCASEGGAASATEAAVSAAVDEAAEAPAAEATEAAPAANRVCEILGIEKPVVSAPMYSLTTGEFVAAVSEAGGCGMLNMATLSDEKMDLTPEEVFALAEEHIQAIHDNTSKPFALSMPYFEVPGVKDMVIDAQPAIVIPNLMTPDDIYDLRDAGIKIMGAAYDADPETLVQMANDTDIIYLKCYGCGGSIPTSRANAVALLQKFSGLELDAPIIPGGGIANAAGAAAVTAAGAEGVFVGTRFLASEESPMHPDAKQALLDLKCADMIEVDTGIAYSHCNASPKALELRDRFWGGEDAQSVANESYNMYLYGMRQGKLDEWMLSVDDSVDSITEILTCKQIVDELGDAVLNMQAMMA